MPGCHSLAPADGQLPEIAEESTVHAVIVRAVVPKYRPKQVGILSISRANVPKHIVLYRLAVEKLSNLAHLFIRKFHGASIQMS